MDIVKEANCPFFLQQEQLSHPVLNVYVSPKAATSNSFSQVFPILEQYGVYFPISKQLACIETF